MLRDHDHAHLEGQLIMHKANKSRDQLVYKNIEVSSCSHCRDISVGVKLLVSHRPQLSTDVIFTKLTQLIQTVTNTRLSSKEQTKLLLYQQNIMRQSNDCRLV